jgi:hypothetical protein
MIVDIMCANNLMLKNEINYFQDEILKKSNSFLFK